MKALRSRVYSFQASWNRFWFEVDGREQVRLFRLFFGILLFFFYATRSFDLELFYSDSGISPLSTFADVMQTPYRYTFLQYFTSHAALLFFHGLFLLSLLLLASGVWPRTVSILALVLHLSFVHRNMAVVYGVDLVSSFFLFLLCMADFRRGPRKTDFWGLLGSVAFRLSQIQVCIIYFYSGIEKLKGPSWWRGEAIWGVLANSMLARWDFSVAASFPMLILAATYATLLWEIYFPVLVWFKTIRPFILLFGVLLHLGIALAVNLPYFGILMILTYIFFLDSIIAQRSNAFIKKSLPRFKFSAQ